MNSILKLAYQFKKLAQLHDIILNDTEKKIFNLLLDVIKSKSPNTILRVAGGWIRDKMLGKDSNDIDIAVSNMTGAKFAKLVQDFMQENGLEKSKIAVIEANPEQSKHLETATIKIFDIPIDFANLRQEVYTDSRIPKTEFGTA